MRRTLVYALLIVLCWSVFLGASDNKVGLFGSLGGQRVGLSNDVTGGQKYAGVDTVKITTRHTTYPNAAASDSGWVYADGYYDYINESTDGSKIMWGYVDGDNGGTLYDQSYYIFTRGIIGEDDADSTSIDELAFLWFDLTGLEGMRTIEEAYITINVAAFSTINLDAGEYVSVRLDTIASDYAITSETIIESAGADSNRFNASWNELAATAGTVWTPSLGSRDDRHDYGPRSDNRVEGPASLTAGTPLRFNVTDALQQHLDNGMTDQGALFIIYADRGTGDGAGNALFSAGYHATYVGSTGRGNPQLTVTATSRPSLQPWNGRRAPLVVIFDDNRDAHSQAVGAFNAGGVTMNVASYVTGFNANASYEATLDSVNSLDIIHHSYDHSLIGETSGAGLNAQLEKSDWYSSTYWASPPDTNKIDHFAWTGGTPTTGARYSIEAIEKIINYGYKTARGSAYRKYDVCPIGSLTYMAWDWPVNLYALAAPNMSVLIEDGGSPGSEAYVREQLGDYIDTYYTDYGKSAIIVYGHGNTGQEDGINEATMGYLVDAAADFNSTEIIGYREMYSLRRSNFIDPADISGWNDDIDTSAARYDSLASANGVTWTNSVWMGPRTGAYDKVSYIPRPSNLQVTGGDDLAVLVWDMASTSFPVTYSVYKFYEGSSDTSLVASGITDKFYGDTSAVNGTETFYMVSAVNANTAAAGNKSLPASDFISGSLSLPSPAYVAVWHQDPPNSAAPVDSVNALAEFDAVITGPFSLEGPSNEPYYDGLADDLRAINSDIVLLTQMKIITVREDWVDMPAGTPQKRTWDYIASLGDSSAADASYGFAQNLSGYVTEPDVYPQWFANVMIPAIADTCARYMVDGLVASGMDGAYSGFFIDLADSSLYDWICDDGGCTDVMDYDQDGVPYSSDADEKAAYKEFQMRFIKALRREFGERDMSDRLIVINGDLARTNAANAKYVDGWMWESWNQYTPGPQGSESAWENSFAATDMLVNSQTNPPFVLYASRLDSSSAYVNEAVALASGGLVHVHAPDDYNGNAQIPPMPRRLPNPGAISSYDAANDTLVVEAAQYTARLAINHTATDTFGVWPYFIVSGTDTISRGGGWPRELPVPRDLYIAEQSVGDDVVVFEIGPLDQMAADGVSQIEVYRGATEGGLALYDYPEFTFDEYTDNSAKNDSTYYYAVVAVNADGLKSGYSNVLPLTATSGVTFFTDFATFTSGADHDTTSGGNFRFDMDVTTSGVGYMRPQFRRHDGTYSDWSDTTSMAWLNPAADDWSGLYDTGVPIADAAEDSGGIRITWDAGTGHDGYLLEMSANGGAWAVVDGSVSADSTGFTHAASASPPPRRGELRYRLRGYNSDPDTTAVATHDSLFYNQAIRVYARFHAIADTLSDFTNIVESPEVSALYVSYPPPGAPDTTPPDTTGIFSAVAFDTTTASNVKLVMTGTAGEAVQVWGQWKNGSAGTWTPAERWLPGSHAAAISDSIGTLDSTATLDGDTVYVRLKVRDTSDNASDFIGANDGNWIAKYFERDVPSAVDTVGYSDTAYDDSRDITGTLAYGARIVMTEAGSITKGYAYLTPGTADYGLKAALYSDNGDGSGTVLAQGELTVSSGGAEGWHAITFDTPYTASGGEDFYLFFKATDSSPLLWSFDTETAGTPQIAWYESAQWLLFPQDPLYPNSTYTDRRFAAYLEYE